MSLTTGHTCNAYCRGDEHCDLLYVAPATLARDHIWQTLAASHGVWATDAVPAREAPPASALPHDRIAGSGPADTPWLVWWRADYAACRAQFSAGALPRWRTPLEGSR